MTNNDVFQLILNTFDLNDNAVIKTFALADFKVTPEQVSAWLKNGGHEDFIKLTGTELALFLNGFINLKRGKREGPQPKPETFLNNNMIFQKLRIALNLKAEDILNIFELVDVHFSKHEISAFFRKPDNKHYKKCRDETLEYFLQGVQDQRLAS